MLVALLVCLIPTTIGALLSAIGIAGHGPARAAQRARDESGRAVEAAGDCSTLLLDKTGTITLGNRQAAEFLPVPASTSASSPTRRSSRASPTRRPRAARSSSLAEGALRPARARARRRRARPVHRPDPDERRRLRRPLGSARARPTRSARWVEDEGGAVPRELDRSSTASRRPGGTPLVVAERRPRRSASIHLKDIVKQGMRERFDELRAMGIRTVMITGDNPLTARGDRRRRPASTTSSPRRRPRTRWR